MGTTNVEFLSPAAQEQFGAMAEPIRQLPRRSGVPDGVSVAYTVALHMIRIEELAHARGASGPPAPTAAIQEALRGIS